MKRFFCLLLCLCLLCPLWGCSTVRLGDCDSGTVRFHAGEKNIDATLSAADLQTVLGIFEGKSMSKGMPSCGFTPDVAICLNGTSYCIANDTCPYIFVQESLRYFKLSEEENQTLRTLMERYGCSFPCN